MQNFRNLRQPLLGEKLPKERERREKTPLIVETQFRAAHASDSDHKVRKGDIHDRADAANVIDPIKSTHDA